MRDQVLDPYATRPWPLKDLLAGIASAGQIIDRTGNSRRHNTQSTALTRFVTCYLFSPISIRSLVNLSTIGITLESASRSFRSSNHFKCSTSLPLASVV